MNITFLIGNGFDLQNNLKTTFSDFFEYIIQNDMVSEDNYIYKKFNEDKNKDLWSDFEKKLGQLTMELKEERVTTEKFMDDLEGFRDDFINYMIGEQNKFELHEKNGQQIFRETIENFDGNLRYEEQQFIREKWNYSNGNNCYFLNFNYTDTLKRTLIDCPISNTINDQNYYLRDLIHVHRTLDDGTFLGVNDESQLNAEVFSEDELDSLIKPRNNVSEITEMYERIGPIIDSSHIIYIFGMSLGDTDRYWWQLISKWLLGHSNRRLIINEYVKEEVVIRARKHTNTKRKIIRSVKEKFLSHLDNLEDELNEINEKIYVSIGADKILNIMSKK